MEGKEVPVRADVYIEKANAWAGPSPRHLEWVAEDYDPEDRRWARKAFVIHCVRQWHGAQRSRNVNDHHATRSNERPLHD